MNRQIILKDVKEIDNFTKYGEKFSKVFADDEKHIYVFKRESKNGVISWEIFKSYAKKNPDGSIVYYYPSSNDFGCNAFYVGGAYSNIAMSKLKKHYQDLLKTIDE